MTATIKNFIKTSEAKMILAGIILSITGLILTQFIDPKMQFDLFGIFLQSLGFIFWLVIILKIYTSAKAVPVFLFWGLFVAQTAFIIYLLILLL